MCGLWRLDGVKTAHFSFNGTLIGSHCRKKGGIMPRLGSASLLKSFSRPPLQDGRLSRTVGWAGGTALLLLNCLWSCSVACWPFACFNLWQMPSNGLVLPKHHSIEVEQSKVLTSLCLTLPPWLLSQWDKKLPAAKGAVLCSGLCCCKSEDAIDAAIAVASAATVETTLGRKFGQADCGQSLYQGFGTDGASCCREPGWILICLTKVCNK